MKKLFAVVQLTKSWEESDIVISSKYLIPTGIYLFKVNNGNTRTRCEVCSKLTANTLVSLLLTLNIFHTLI